MTDQPIDKQPSNEEIAEVVCRSLTTGAHAWAMENYTYASTVMYYMAMLRHLESHPFENDEVHRKVMYYLGEKLDQATGQLLSEALRHLGIVLKQMEKPKEA